MQKPLLGLALATLAQPALAVEATANIGFMSDAGFFGNDFDGAFKLYP